jgi:hypothetical protein
MTRASALPSPREGGDRLEIFERLGAEPWATRAANELRATGQTRSRARLAHPKLGITSRAALRDALDAPGLPE